jgi:hypothetical protein
LNKLLRDTLLASIRDEIDYYQWHETAVDFFTQLLKEVSTATSDESLSASEAYLINYVADLEHAFE